MAAGVDTTYRVDQWRSYRGGQGGGIAPPPSSGKWKIRKFAIWGKMTPNYGAVLDFDYQLRRHGLLPSNNYSQSPTKQLNKSGSRPTWGVRSIKIFSQVLTALLPADPWGCYQLGQTLTLVWECWANIAGADPGFLKGGGGPSQARIQDFLKGGLRHSQAPPPWTLPVWRHPHSKGGGSNFGPNVKKPTLWPKRGGSGPPGPPWIRHCIEGLSWLGIPPPVPALPKLLSNVWTSVEFLIQLKISLFQWTKDDSGVVFPLLMIVSLDSLKTEGTHN